MPTDYNSSSVYCGGWSGSGYYNISSTSPGSGYIVYNGSSWYQFVGSNCCAVYGDYFDSKSKKTKKEFDI